MEHNLRDEQLERLTEQVVQSLTMGDLPLCLGVWSALGAGLAALYDAFATPESGCIARAFKGLAM